METREKHFIWEAEVFDGPKKLKAPYLFNVISDSKEQTNIMMTKNWVHNPMMDMLH